MLRMTAFAFLLSPAFALPAHAATCPQEPEGLRYDTGSRAEVLDYGRAGKGSVTLRQTIEESGKSVEQTFWAGILTISAIRNGEEALFDWQTSLPSPDKLVPGFELRAEAKLITANKPVRFITAEVKALAFEAVEVDGCRYEALKVEVKNFDGDTLMRTETRWVNPASMMTLKSELLEPGGARYMQAAYELVN